MKILQQNFLKPTVAIGSLDKGVFTASATGFLVLKRGSLNGKSFCFLVTNRHVIDKYVKEGKKEIAVRFGSETIKISLSDETHVKSIENVDLAVFIIHSKIFNNEKISNSVKVFDFDKNFITSDEMLKKGVAPGHGIFVSGFPLGIAGKERNFPILRSGIIARLDEEILKENKMYLIDCSIHQGNSGGFVILKSTKGDLPIQVKPSRKGTVENFCIAGVVFEALNKTKYIYKKIIERNEIERTFSEESIDLGCVIPMEYVKKNIIALSVKLGILEKKIKIRLF